MALELEVIADTDSQAREREREITWNGFGFRNLKALWPPDGGESSVLC